MFPAGATVRGGYYVNRDELDVVAIAGKEGTLPGSSGQRFYPVSTLAVVAMTPLLGALFVILMPVIALTLALGQSGRLSFAGFKTRARRLLSVSSLGRGRAADPGARKKRQSGNGG